MVPNFRIWNEFQTNLKRISESNYSQTNFEKANRNYRIPNYTGSELQSLVDIWKYYEYCWFLYIFHRYICIFHNFDLNRLNEPFWRQFFMIWTATIGGLCTLTRIWQPGPPVHNYFYCIREDADAYPDQRPRYLKKPLAYPCDSKFR